ncbi:MAG TPA: four helix bundle protein [Bacteroidia bacterium]|jgi:four helix bundle protein|nr:four helix bundle protein [Bacteroidia bacterium]HQF27894.1 four helix bundle protein [Bacteroidia bacterium]HQK97491.1 four helix bundle protein [Bacteroidia bacterium]
MINFRSLLVWKVSIAYAVKLYPIIIGIVEIEQYGLISQMKRSSVSICSNIAEGCSRKSTREVSRFFDIALGSSYELETQLILVRELELLDKEVTSMLISELNYIQAMLNKYNRKLMENPKKSLE